MEEPRGAPVAKVVAVAHEIVAQRSAHSHERQEVLLGVQLVEDASEDRRTSLEGLCSGGCLEDASIVSAMDLEIGLRLQVMEEAHHPLAVVVGNLLGHIDGAGQQAEVIDQELGDGEGRSASSQQVEFLGKGLAAVDPRQGLLGVVVVALFRLFATSNGLHWEVRREV